MSDQNEDAPSGASTEQLAVKMAEAAVETARESGEASARIDALSDRIVNLETTVQLQQLRINELSEALSAQANQIVSMSEKLFELMEDVDKIEDEVDDVEESAESAIEVAEESAEIVEEKTDNPEVPEKKTSRVFISLNPFKRK